MILFQLHQLPRDLDDQLLPHVSDNRCFGSIALHSIQLGQQLRERILVSMHYAVLVRKSQGQGVGIALERTSGKKRGEGM